MKPTDFESFFFAATQHQPFDWQRRLADGDEGCTIGSLLIHIPTGLGKTAGVVLAWLWQSLVVPREGQSNRCPRRLVYCLPMRTLVEQTQSAIETWLRRLLNNVEGVGLSACAQQDLEWLVSDSPVVLMGGEISKSAWDIHPDKRCILIGTQDMLLSRALNRGYAAGRARWPKDFALLNNDCLWVFDEVQLMGSGFATSLQLQGWREELRLRDRADTFQKPMPDTLAAPSHSWWMSATLDRDWFQHGVDYRKQVPTLVAACEAETKRLWNEDVKKDARVGVLLTQNAKSLQPVLLQDKKVGIGKKAVVLKLKKDQDTEYLNRFAEAVWAESQATDGQLVLAIVNTVDRAVSLAQKLKQKGQQPLLLHSRFRAHERKELSERLRGNPQLVIATQVVEAGVNLSADVLFTEACPWPSFIQRVGRCARGFVGRAEKPAAQRGIVFWTDVSDVPAPYRAGEISEMISELAKLNGEANLAALKRHTDELEPSERRRLLPYEPRFVPREKDLFDLFDTTPDLTGADVDIARFIRDTDELDVQVFWRNCEDLNVSDDPPKSWRPQHAELCPVPVSGFRQFVRGRTGRIWRWDYRDGWTRLSMSESERIYPGQVFLLEASCGGYDMNLGWTGILEDNPWKSKADLLGPWGKNALGAQAEEPDESDDSEALSATGQAGQWRNIITHTREVCDELNRLLECPAVGSSVSDSVKRVLRLAARLHDWGKAHAAFQGKLRPEAVASEHGRTHSPVAKAPDDCWRRDQLKRQPADTCGRSTRQATAALPPRTRERLGRSRTAPLRRARP